MDWLEEACKAMMEKGEAVSMEEAELLLLMMDEEEIAEMIRKNSDEVTDK